MKKSEKYKEFDKTLTKEELATETYLEWSNETLGRCVRFIESQLREKDIKGFESIKTMAAAYTLINTAIKINSETFIQKLEGFSIKEKQYGDWEITVKKITP